MVRVVGRCQPRASKHRSPSTPNTQMQRVGLIPRQRLGALEEGEQVVGAPIGKPPFNNGNNMRGLVWHKRRDYQPFVPGTMHCGSQLHKQT